MDIDLDDILCAVVPVLFYWLYAGMYTFVGFLDEGKKKHISHLGHGEENNGDDDEKDSKKKNTVTQWAAAVTVLRLQATQALFSFCLVQVISKEMRKYNHISRSPLESAFRFLSAMLIFDTWQYFCHRLMHNNHFLYKHVHSKHHRMVATFPIGALYTHPVEFFMVDTMGPLLGFILSGITKRSAMYFFSLAIARVVDDHCSRKLPWNPIQVFFWENTKCHQLHHQFYGYKYNFSSPFFLVWDKILGTHLPCSLEENKKRRFLD